MVVHFNATHNRAMSRVHTQLTVKCILITALLCGLSFPVVAQQETVTPTESIATFQKVLSGVTADEAEQFKLLDRSDDQIWQKDRLESEISNVREVYRGQLETYRAQEKTFFIAKDQYQRLQTLDSIEQAVKSTRQTMLSRDQVLFTYLTLLRLRLIDADGVEISYKQQVLERIDVILAQLETHHAKVLTEYDRQKINTLSDDFLPIGEDIKITASHALALLNLGKLQSVYDRSVLLFDEVQAEVANTNGRLTAAEKQRYTTETQRTLDKTSTTLKLITGRLGERMQDKSEIRPGSDLSGSLNQTYSYLSKVLGYFQELLKRSAE